MADYPELMRLLSVPRPNGSAAERATAAGLRAWLDARGIAHATHAFGHYPYFFESIGVWLIVSRTLLALAVWLRWGWAALPIALIGMLGGSADVALHWPVVSWPGARRGENIVVQFEPPAGGARQELLVSAHYDSKTEWLDHRRRMFFLRNLPTGIALTLLLGVLGPLGALLHADAFYWLGSLLALPMLYLAWGLGLNLATGRLLAPSQGAVDNGAACAIVLGLAERLARGDPALQRTRVTLALFTGEEVSMQGSLAYARDHDRRLPLRALNLEVMAQDGDYVLWEHDGNAFRLLPTDGALSAAVSAAVEKVTGRPPVPGGPLNSDGGSFLLAGIPAATLGTYDTRLRDRGFHSPADRLERVVMARLPEAVEILCCFLQAEDRDPG